MNREPSQSHVSGPHVLRVPPVDTHYLRSERVRQNFKIQVMQPPRREGDTGPVPVVYVTDGNWVFDLFKSISYLLQMRAEDAPPFMLVGIGYPSDSPFAGMLLRAREYTFPPYPNFVIRSAYEPSAQHGRLDLYEGALLPEEGAKDFYGGEDFRDFLRDQLIPFIDARYPTVPGDRTYFGHSGGGFFGLYTLFTDPSVFRNYIVSSPGLLYDGEAPGGAQYRNYDCGAQLVRDFLASGRTFDGHRLYMSVGAEEEFERVIQPWQVVSGFYQVARLIKEANISGLELMTEAFANETHKTAWPIAFMHGVQALLGTRRVTRCVYW